MSSAGDKRYKTRNVEKPFPCPFCGKVFARQGSLVGHIRVHTGERPHQCQTCGRRFSDSSSLTKHIRTHTGEKPFLCSFCHRAFSISHNLTRHLKLHSSDRHSKPHLYSLTKRAKVGRNVVFKCQFCELVFQTSSSLKSHRQTHSIANSQLNTRSIQCKYCKLRFLNFSVLRIHLKTHIKKNKHSEQNQEKFKTKVNDSYIVELSEDCKVETNKGSAEDNGPLLQQFGANQATYSQDPDVKKSQTYSASQIGNIPPDVNCITAFVSSKTKSVAMVLDKNMSCNMDASQNIVSNETDFQQQLLLENTTSDSNFVKILQMDSMLEPLFDNHQQPIVFNKREQENCDTVQPPSIQQNYTSEQWFTNERKHLKQEFNNSHSETLPISIHVDVNKITELDAVSNSTIKSDKKQQCSHCQKIFLNVDQLSSHQLLEHSDASSVGAREIAKHVCLVCMVSFPTLAELQLHSKICCRNNGNKFTCSFCCREFSRNSGLIGHLRTHTRERPYVCATCNRRFSDSSSLTKHNRTHTGEKPFKCKHCFRAFSISHNLTRHLKLHERV